MISENTAYSALRGTMVFAELAGPSHVRLFRSSEGKKLRKTIRCVAANIAIALLFGLSQASHAAFRIVDSQSWLLSGGNPKIYWLDNKRVLYIGDENVTRDWTREPQLTLFSWEIGKSRVLIQRGVDMICYRPGQVLYVVWDKQAKTRTFYQGELGHEAMVQAKVLDAIGCDITREPDRSQNRSVLPLLPGHGYLYMGPRLGKESMKNTPVMLFPGEAKEEIRLPFGRRESHAPKYYQFRGAYFFELAYYDPAKGYSSTTWPKNKLRVAYWVWPDGHTEKVEFPNDILGPYPTKAGIAYRIFGAGATDGVYLLAPNGERKLVISGYVVELAISPDGCGIAFSHAPDQKSYVRGPQNKRTLKVVEIC
ncbi:MAG TPA: hypothetical protein VK572_00940 [Burkholderiales bacterium]|nr:hypothetical protein [Burkholderiales bacterium]